MANNVLTTNSYQKLANDISKLIKSNKEKTDTLVRNQVIITYWEIGKRIKQDQLSLKSNYQSLVLEEIGKELDVDKTILLRSVQFFDVYPIRPKGSNLSWSHYKSLIAVKDDDLRLELEERAKKESWTRDQLSQNIAKDSNKFASKKLARPTKPNYLYKARITNVIDGDTIVLNVDLGFQVIKEQRIRLAKIDAPELKTPAGLKSFHYLRDLCARLDQIVVRTNKIDIYGRYIGDVFFLRSQTNQRTTQLEIFQNGIYLNEQLVSKGFASAI